MTSDAKIGLLLALVFIFVIAFIVNGIPRFNSEKTSNDLSRRVLEVRDTPPIGQRERTVNNRVLDTSTRFEMPLSNSFQGTNEGVEQPSGLRADQSELDAASRQERIEVISPTAQQQQRAAQQVEAPETVVQVERPDQQEPRIYVVEENDMLAIIAKKVYGEVEGNRLVNVQRIYAANGDILDSPDAVFPGQKLVIPPLPVGSARGLDTNVLLERAETIGARHTPAEQRTSTARNMETYVVGPDDSLWKIAAEKLGNGSRYMEIYELNKDILPNEHTVREGMRIRIPSN